MRALVAFGTKYGSTIKVGEGIGQVLREEGLEAEVANLDERKVRTSQHMIWSWWAARS